LAVPFLREFYALQLPSVDVVVEALIIALGAIVALEVILRIMRATPAPAVPVPAASS
jgi:hydrogenase/urease accessory protein HupE